MEHLDTDGLTDREILILILNHVATLATTLEKFKPLLDRYERGEKIGVFAARKILKEGSNGVR